MFVIEKTVHHNVWRVIFICKHYDSQVPNEETSGKTQVKQYDKNIAYYFISKTGFMFMENRSIVSNKYHLSLWRHGTTSGHQIQLSKAWRMSGVKDIKLIADTAVFSIISICLTMYCDVEAHDQTSGLGLKTSKLIFIWNRQSSQPQNHSPNGFSVFEFRIKIQLFNYHIYSVALAYFTGDALQTIFLCRWGLKKKILLPQITTITEDIRLESWNRFPICEIFFAVGLFCPQTRNWTYWKWQQS